MKMTTFQITRQKSQYFPLLLAYFLYSLTNRTESTEITMKFRIKCGSDANLKKVLFSYSFFKK